MLQKLKKKGLIKRLYKKAFSIVGKLPADKKLVMFESFLGKQYSCNPRAIYEYLKENHPEYKLVWSVDKRYAADFEEKNLPYIERFSVKWLFHMARARYWVSNSRLPLWIPKPAHTIYLQTWHGTPLKKLAMDMEEVHMPGTNTEKYKRNFYNESRNWDYLISPNAYSTEIFKRAFQFDKEMIESGYPRNDYLLHHNNEETIKQVKERLNLPLDKKILLYAPTWRDNEFYGKGRYKFDIKLDLEKMREELGDEYIIILRMHYLISESLDLSPFEGFAYNYSHHEDIRELYLISDQLITDYSSVFFDYANLKRPMIFFAYDIASYRDQLRGFYFDFENEAPGPIVKTTDQVIEQVKHLDKNSLNYQDFHQTFCYLEDGRASERVVKAVFK
ncbi:CDP-glycerol glycerophosphotransferase family protein [Bacillus enclensis]|nr:CDP-glycerol glycerophosphotransferase family protein [[Bacillus] enclensis]